MRTFQHQMALRVDYLPFLLGIATPQQENQTISLVTKLSNHAIRERLPTPALMRGGFSLLHRQDAVEQENPLFSPRSQAAMAQGGKFWLSIANVSVNFLEYVE